MIAPNGEGKLGPLVEPKPTEEKADPELIHIYDSKNVYNGKTLTYCGKLMVVGRDNNRNYEKHRVVDAAKYCPICRAYAEGVRKGMGL